MSLVPHDSITLLTNNNHPFTAVLYHVLIKTLTAVLFTHEPLRSHVFLQGWENELISWEPNDWCGIESVAVPRDMLWIPDVMILEE